MFFYPKMMIYTIKKFLIKIKNILFLLNFHLKKKKLNKRKIKKINTPLILISQIQRSGGTMITQLFDNHNQILSYPHELRIFNPAWNFLSSKNFYTFKMEPFASMARDEKYIKNASIKNQEGHKLKFNLDYQKFIFDKYSKSSDLNLRQKFNLYFTSFFNSFENLKTNFDKKKYLLAFIPRSNLYKKNFEIFFEMYPDGFIISLTREPLSWLSSAIKHSLEYQDVNYALKIWYNTTNLTLKMMKKQDRVLLVNFEEIINKPKSTLRKLCKKLKITYDESLSIPTFNGEKILSDSSFKSVRGQIDKTTLSRKNNLNDKIRKKIKKEIEKKCTDLYEETKKYSI